ncbi:hypothetical protein VPNG_09329 [Cytospora leucostoma]|uniref:Uncharacterized protein n=1 Tax=Cytospora leucostoma TaxID=1230097 RepID=A0A423VT39_9PEZI|nr:hypothetical protein VPNG_09329 [Cytospora leucostoma]
MANEGDRAGLIGAAVGAFFTCILAGIWLRLILGPSKPLLPLNQSQDQHEQELQEVPPRRNRGLDLERGVVGGEFQLRDPDMFMIPEEDEGGEFDPTTHHGAMVNSVTGEQHSKKVRAPPRLRLNPIDTVVGSCPGDREIPQLSRQHVMSEATPVLEDDDMMLMPPGASLSQGDPSTFEIEDTTISSKNDIATQWKPAPPKVSRYRGLSATRPGQEAQVPSPSQSHIDNEHVVPQTTGPLPTMFPSQPASETFTVKTRPDSWENFSYTGGNDTDGDPDEWSSQVCSTVAEPQRAEAFQALHVGADKAPTKADEDIPGGHQERSLAGPFTPSPRILEQKASLPGRKSKFLEVDVDALPVGESRELALVRKCVGLLREGARTPTVFTSHEEVESPVGEGQDFEHA